MVIFIAFNFSIVFSCFDLYFKQYSIKYSIKYSINRQNVLIKHINYNIKKLVNNAFSNANILFRQIKKES